MGREYIVRWRKTTSNRTPMTDVAELIRTEIAADSEGVETTTETGRRQIFCTVSQGVVRAEYYEALRNGIILCATVECWEQDYEGEKLLELNGRRYRIERSYPTGYGFLELYCAEETKR